MGGNALKNTQTRRLSKAEFEAVSAAVADTLARAFPAGRVASIPAYRAKADFGDLDILLSTEGMAAGGGGERLRRLATDTFNATELFKNGSVLSFDYRSKPDQAEPGFQVDVITSPEIEFDFSLAYFSFNDLGNLIGRTAHKQGASFGHDGLWYYFRDGDYSFREILLTRDHDLALRFLGYDPSRFHRGFEDLEEIFQYVAGSEFFNRDIFLLANRNNQSRVRDRKRKTYTEFLQWCEARPNLPAYTYPEDKASWLPRLFRWFPAFEDDYRAAQRDLAILRQVKTRFNGEIVAKLTGLHGKELGGLMKQIRNGFDSSEALHQFVLANTPEVINSRIRQAVLELAIAADAPIEVANCKPHGPR
jgi:hypothetical protein